jgi:cytochrome c oxidase cbb3-type subunit 3
MADEKHEIDAFTGVRTTGHEWDGIRELNTPLPRWWLWLFYATIVWSVGYWIVYPSWPLISSYTRGLSDWHAREAVIADLDALKRERGPLFARLAETPLQAVMDDPQLLEFTRAVGKPAFAENCAPCHGAGGQGGKGYAHLADDDWLWGGRLTQIEETIRHGVRASDINTRMSVMPAFGRDGILLRPEIDAVADYVRSLSGLPADAGADLGRGKAVFTQHCTKCHGNTGTGNRDLGAPNLTDAIWLYGPEKSVIVEGLINGRGAVMPAWGGRLDEVTIKALAVYVHILGGGEK